MIIETSDNRFYRVEDAGLPHVWWGTQVHEICKDFWVDKRGASKQLVRKAATRIVIFNEASQREHGRRVEERQRVNGQPNGYRPISEAELRRSAPRNALRNAVNRAIANGSPIFENQKG